LKGPGSGVTASQRYCIHQLVIAMGSASIEHLQKRTKKFPGGRKGKKKKGPLFFNFLTFFTFGRICLAVALVS